MVLECDDDADRPIAMKGIEIAREEDSVTVVDDDTDILVMLVHMWDHTLGELFLHSEARKNITKRSRNNQHKECGINSTKSCERMYAVYPCMEWL